MHTIHIPQIHTDIMQPWVSYTLLDTGEGRKLEQFGSYIIDRPEAQAMWKKSLDATEWQKAGAIFVESDGERGSWKYNRTLPERWEIPYMELSCVLRMTTFRHIGVFPEQSSQWEWMRQKVVQAKRPVHILNLFGYTGIASLLLAQTGAMVTHVDASKKVVSWAAENQQVSHLSDAKIRWIVDDAQKFVQREYRRGVRYDGILLDPPKFGRGPKGELWKLEESLPDLLRACQSVLSPSPLFFHLSVYAVRMSSISIFQVMREVMRDQAGKVEGGEIMTQDTSGRFLSHALYARWSSASPRQ